MRADPCVCVARQMTCLTDASICHENVSIAPSVPRAKASSPPAALPFRPYGSGKQCVGAMRRLRAWQGGAWARRLGASRPHESNLVDSIGHDVRDGAHVAGRKGEGGASVSVRSMDGAAGSTRRGSPLCASRLTPECSTRRAVRLRSPEVDNLHRNERTECLANLVEVTCDGVCGGSTGA